MMFTKTKGVPPGKNWSGSNSSSGSTSSFTSLRDKTHKSSSCSEDWTVRKNKQFFVSYDFQQAFHSSASLLVQSNSFRTISAVYTFCRFSALFPSLTKNETVNVKTFKNVFRSLLSPCIFLSFVLISFSAFFLAFSIFKLLLISVVKLLIFLFKFSCSFHFPVLFFLSFQLHFSCLVFSAIFRRFC